MCSSGEQNEVLCIRFADLPNSFHNPPCRDVIKQQVNFLIHYESDCGYKGHNIALQCIVL